jgi:amino acid transporter
VRITALFDLTGLASGLIVMGGSRDLPIAITASLAIVTALYVAVCCIVTGLARYDQVDVSAPLSSAFQRYEKPSRYLLALP